jgi:hypothetical protein
MFDLCRKWFTPGVKLEEQDLKATIHLVVKVAIALFLVALGLGIYVLFTSHRPTAVADQAPDAMVRLLTAIGVWGVIGLITYATIQAWDNTGRAASLLHVQAGDRALVILAKTLGAALTDASIILAAALVFGRVVGL